MWLPKIDVIIKCNRQDVICNLVCHIGLKSKFTKCCQSVLEKRICSRANIT